MGVVRPFPPDPAIFAEPGGPFRGNLLHTLSEENHSIFFLFL